MLTGLRVSAPDATFVVGLLGSERVPLATRVRVVERIHAMTSSRATDPHAA